MSIRKRRNAPGSTKPQMTSLVDVLTILLVFLIKNFSTGGEIMVMDKSLQLPASTAEEKPRPSLILAVSRRHILADGRPLALVEEEAARPSMQIPALERYLAERKQLTREISRFDEDVEFEGDITIQGDRKIPFWILQKVLRTCGEAGYSNFSLAVVKKEE